MGRRKLSYTLEKSFVQEIFLRSSQASGIGFLGMGVTYSVFQSFGQFPEVLMQLQMLVSGLAIHWAVQFTSLGNKSPGTLDLGFLKSSSSFSTCGSVIIGRGAVKEEGT